MPADSAASSPSVDDLHRRIAEVKAENARLQAELRIASQQQTATSEVLEVINSSPGDQTRVFDAILKKAHALCGVAHGSLQLFDGESFHAVALHNVPDDIAARLRQGYAPGPYLPVRQLLAGASYFHAHDLAEIDHPIARAAAKFVGTTLYLALRKDDRLLGQIVAAREEVRDFSDKEITLLQHFAQQAVIAMENARLLGELRQRTDDLTESLEYQTATSELLAVINRSKSDVHSVLETMWASASRLCHTRFGGVAVRTGDVFHYVVAASGRSDMDDMLLAHAFHIDRASAIGRVALTRNVVHIPDAQADREYSTPTTDAAGMRTLLGVPLLQEGEVIGVIVLVRDRVEPFSERQIALVRTFAAQAVIAVENARLLNETREALERQTATADILKVIARSPNDVQPVFEAIAERSNKLASGLSTAVYRVVDDVQHLMSFTRTSPEADAALRALFPTRVSAIFADVVHKGEVFRIADSEVELADEPAFRDLARLRGWRSVLAVPLLQDRKTIGMITVTRAEPGLFADRHVELLRTFADQAVIAISNVRLFEEVQERTRELSRSLDDLRAAQSRLIQSEKLASLGQLTAGIAHEIKNPLNFVNNFAGLSTELLQELKETMEAAIATLTAEAQAEVDEVIDTLSNNLAKIVEHGKRADGIVRSMLQHSRGSTGERRSVDMNGLVEEALNLAYHGARAQDQTFNITLKRELHADIAPVEVVPQDMTRVFLNLFGNGFYATRKRQRESGDDAYRPELGVATRDLGDAIEVRVRDNGVGVPPDIRDKLFQPFFTTKPTGEGTGLGLSISYDIVTQQHGGTIEVESKVGQYTEFAVRLPRSRQGVPMA